MEDQDIWVDILKEYPLERQGENKTGNRKMRCDSNTTFTETLKWDVSTYKSLNSMYVQYKEYWNRLPS